VFLAWFDDPRYRRRLTARERPLRDRRARLRRGGARADRPLRARLRAAQLAALGDRESLPGRRRGLPPGVPELPRAGVPLHRPERLRRGPDPEGDPRRRTPRSAQATLERAGASVPQDAPRDDRGADRGEGLRRRAVGDLDAAAGRGQYVIACDPATGEEDTDAAFAIEVIDHETRAQVAQYEADTSPIWSPSSSTSPACTTGCTGARGWWWSAPAATGWRSSTRSFTSTATGRCTRAASRTRRPATTPTGSAGTPTARPRGSP
jgi:hypothetical protein